ncbi:glutathione S-transferase PARB-like [Dorcoceras hygrometricum]|uniref:glutathione transferase n=1 Tax=Dorcoceras hygrometricum TaxID=472368 RepID=A0A2Z7BY28_9LAMI|nr:glutathione S-transferase PARB-like [Dorcoceras hygrometricum]
MGIKVHGATPSTATRRVCACLNEKGLDYEFILVDMRAGEHKKDPFLSLQNHLLIFINFSHAAIWSSARFLRWRPEAFWAINRYIAYTYADNGAPLVSQNPKEMASEFVWMDVEALRYDLPASKLAWELSFKPKMGMPADDVVVEENLSLLSKVLDVYEARLTQSKYLAGNSYTLADLNHLPTLSYLMETRAKAVFYSRPHVRAWCENILERTA